MNSARHEQVKKLFLAACELEPSQVGAFLDAACGADGALKLEVESLLSHHRDSTILGPVSSRATDRVDQREHGTDRDIGPTSAAIRRREQLIPGTLIGERYRISQFLGAGGMGVVYRADDLWLGAPIAIKFLTCDEADLAAIESLRSEVRLARRVSHPYVTRVHDLGSLDGDLFLTMEFVDGESLASLVERIGPLPEAKLRDVAWEMLAGLQAIHAEGILHCDLKPENVLIDGRGRVRITDFGVALLNRELPAETRFGGTPAFMAPELLSGEPATWQTDVYSLGITLYFACTGIVYRPGVEHESEPDRLLLSIGNEALRAVILRCLEADPRLRPESALAAMESLRTNSADATPQLSGANPAAEEIGVLPVPKLMSRRTRNFVLAGCVVAVLLALGLADRTMLLPRAGMPLTPQQLIARSQAVLGSLRGQHAARDFSHGFALDRPALEYWSAHRSLSQRNLDALAVYSWYRDGETFAQGPVPFGEAVLARDRALRPNVVSILLTADGRLREYLAASGSADLPDGGQRPDWDNCFRWAGLDIAAMRPVRPRRRPPVYADQFAEWEGNYGGEAALPVRVEAAATNGEPVYFRVLFPWEENTPAHAIADFTPTNANWKLCLKMGLFTLLVAGGAAFAVRHVRSGQADVVGARRVAVVTATLVIAEWLFAEAHVAEIGEEMLAGYLWAATALLHGALVAIAYLAVEPPFRNRRPILLAGWTRLLQLRLKDGRVGEELLAGCLVGLCGLLVLQLLTLVGQSLGVAGVLPILPTAGPDTVMDLGELLGLRFFGGVLIHSALRGVTLIWAALIAMLALTRLTTQARVLQCILVVTFAVVMRVTYASDASLPWTTSFIVSGFVTAAILRMGVLASITALFVLFLLTSSPLTLRYEHWFAVTGWCAAAAVLAIAVGGFALANRTSDPQTSSTLPPS